MDTKEDKDFFDNIVSGTEESGAKLSKEVLKVLFSNEREKLLMITELSGDDLIWATAFQAELRFLVDDFIVSKKLRNKCYKFMEDIYKMRISKDRKGRSELFDALKAQTSVDLVKEQGLLSKIRGGGRTI